MLSLKCALIPALTSSFTIKPAAWRHSLIAVLVMALAIHANPVLAKTHSQKQSQAQIAAASKAQSSDSETKKRKKKRKKAGQSAANSVDNARLSDRAERNASKKSKNKSAQAAALDTAKPRKTATKPQAVSDIELAGIYTAIAQGQSASALGQTEALLLKAPNYKLLHLLRADLLLMLSQRYTVKTAAGLSHAFPAMTASQQAGIKELQQEAYLRLNSKAQLNKANNPQLVPKPLLKLADNEPFALVVDSKASRLYVYQNMPNQAPRLVTDFYATQGLQGVFKLKEGDNRTPIGAYFINGPINQKLPDLYGYGALNMDYPSAWDKRMGRTGYGIWLHGTPSDTYARAPFASNGCVVLANPDLEMIFKLANNGAMPIVVVDKLDWVAYASQTQTKQTLLDGLERWRSALEKGDERSLAKLYSTQFSANEGDKKAALIANVGPIARSKISNVLVIEYPGETDLMLLRFDWEGSKTEATQRKQQYWKKESGLWKIVLENSL